MVAQHLQGLPAVAARHHHVQRDGGRVEHGGELDRLIARGRLDHPVRAAPEIAPEQTDGIGIVVHDQNRARLEKGNASADGAAPGRLLDEHGATLRLSRWSAICMVRSAGSRAAKDVVARGPSASPSAARSISTAPARRLADTANLVPPQSRTANSRFTRPSRSSVRSTETAGGRGEGSR